MTQGYQLDHLLSLRILYFIIFFDNILLKHGGLPRVIHNIISLFDSLDTSTLLVNHKGI